jgi:hypothetical protein
LKHHFIPAFFLKQWAGTDDKEVCQMRLINGRVVPTRIHPNATGYEHDLYKTHGVTSEKEHLLEEKFFKPVDTAAELALQKMLGWDEAPWTSESRKAWTRYLLSLRFRNPGTVKDLKAHMLNVFSASKESIRGNYPTWRRSDDPPTWEEFERRLDPAAPYIAATNLMIEIIDNDRIGPVIVEMHWSIHELADSKVNLLTSDHPLDWPTGLSDPKAYIALAISPTVVFLASNDPAMQHRIASISQTRLAKNLNEAVVAKAGEYVWGPDDRQIEFVRKHFGKAPIGSAINSAQKATSLRAAAGERNR